MAKKPSMGRQKIKIQKIEVKNHLQVTFSKRRSGLFKKASELCTLCGVEIAIIVFSPAGKVFSFGHPNVEPIVDRFFARNPSNYPPQQQNPNNDHGDPFHLLEAQRNAGLRELQSQLGQILNELEAEKKRGDELESMRKCNESNYWWEAPVNKLGLSELEQLREAMEELKKNVAHHQQSASMSHAGIFGASGGLGMFDQYEAKPSAQALIMGGSNVNNGGISSNFGYCHGFF